MPGIVLVDELAWPEDTDGKAGLLNSLSTGEDVPAIQGQEELASAVHRGGKDVGILGIDK